MSTDRIPRFVSNQSIEPGPVTSTADVFDSLKKLFSAGITQQAKKAGARAGENLDFSPTLGITPSSKAFNEAGIRANRYAVGADVITKSDQLKKEFANNVQGPETLTEYKDTFQTYANTILDSVPTENRGYTKNLLINQGRRGEALIAKKLKDQSNVQGMEEFYGMYHAYFNEMSNSAAESSETSQQSAVNYYGRLNNMIADANKAGIIGDKTAVDLDRSAQQELQKQNVMGQYRASTDKLGFIQKFSESKKYDKVFSAGQKQTIESNLFALNKKDERIQGINAADINQQKNDLKLQAKRGVQLDHQEFTNVVNFDPANENNLRRQLEQQAQIGANVREHKFAPLGQMDAVINNLSQPISDKEAAKPGAAENQATRKAIANELTQVKHQTLKDPGEAAMQDPAVQEKIQQYDTANPFNPTQTNELTYQATRQQHIQQMVIANLQSRGFPEGNIKAIPNAEASEINSNINRAGFEGGLSILNNLQKVSGPTWKYVHQSLVANGLSKDMQFAQGLQAIPKSEVNMGAIQESFTLSNADAEKAITGGSKTISAINTAVTSNPGMVSFLATLNSAKSPNLAEQAKMISSVQSLAYVYYIRGDAEGKGKDDETTAAKAAYETLLGNRYSEVNNTYRVPENVDPTAVRDMIKIKDKKLSKMDFKVLGTANPALSLSFRKGTDFRDAIRGGHWVSDPTDQNRWVYVAIDGRAVQLEDGKDLSFTTSDLTDPQFLSAAKAVTVTPLTTAALGQSLQFGLGAGALRQFEDQGSAN